MNEDILKSQNVNEIRSFTARESNIMSVYNPKVQNSMRISLASLADLNNSLRDEKTKYHNITPNSRGKDCVS